MITALFPIHWQPSWRLCARCGEPVEQDDCVAGEDLLTRIEVALHSDWDECKRNLG